MSKYPFDQRFIFAIESLDWSTNAWMLLLGDDETAKDELIDAIENIDSSNYSRQYVEKCIRELRKQNLPELVELALLNDYRSYPAIAVLRTKQGKALSEMAARLCASEKAEERALGVKMINRPGELSLGSESLYLLKELAHKEDDDVVLEQIAFAMRRLIEDETQLDVF